MSAPMRHVRVKLSFSILGLYPDDQPQKCWFLINTDDITTIESLKNEIIRRFRLEVEEIVLLLDDCVLPNDESIHILREQDLLSISSRRTKVECADEEEEEMPRKVESKKTKNKKNKKRKSEAAFPEEVEETECHEDAASVGNQRDSDIRPLSLSAKRRDDGHRRSKGKKEKAEEAKEIRHKRSKRDSASDSSAATERVRRSRVSPTVTKGESCHPCSGYGDDNTAPGSHAPRSAAGPIKVQSTQVMEVQEPSSDVGPKSLDSPEKVIGSPSTQAGFAVTADQENSAQKQLESARRKKKRKRNRNKGDVSLSDASLLMLPPDASVCSSGKGVDVTRTEGRQPQPSPGWYMDYRNPPKFNTSSTPHNVHDTTKLSQSRPGHGKAKNTGHILFDSGSEDEVVSPSLMDTTATSVTSASEANLADAATEGAGLARDLVMNGHEDEAAEKAADADAPKACKEQEAGGVRKENHAQKSETLTKGPFANTTVFCRKLGKRNKKNAFYALTKEDQLNTVATNRSYIVKNPTQEDMEEQDTNSSPADNMDKDAHDESPARITAKDYTACATLHGPPRANDVIAYKILELTDNYSPEVSSYKVVGSRRVLVITSSHGRLLEPILCAILPKDHIDVIFKPGAGTQWILNHVLLHLPDWEPTHLIVHIGHNDLSTKRGVPGRSVVETLCDVLEIFTCLRERFRSTKLIYSTVLPRVTTQQFKPKVWYNETIFTFNELAEEELAQSPINARCVMHPRVYWSQQMDKLKCLFEKDGLHLNHCGKPILCLEWALAIVGCNSLE